ncbi:cytochrome c oxidase subunit 3 [Terrimonas ferruginea]|uniref:cytochrome c oxidase subunit 3 n=1 Tax=Terrimonas ferruginea TaxID=249 RepID=UPI0004902172|nr:cytochrome c oxidase subunit 3 [Terrimonas ferruginea]
MHPHKFTLWVAIASILMMFAGLTSAFIVKSNLVGWRTVTMPDVFWISTAVIVASSITMQMAVRAFRQRVMQQYRLLTAITVLLGLGFVVLQYMGFHELWKNNIRFIGASGAGQFLYVIFGLHAIHVIGGMVALVIMFGRAFFGRVKQYSPVPVEVMATYWHFVDILWLYLLVFFLIVG